MNELHVTFEGRSYTFQPGQTVYIGRMTDNSIVVGDPTVSRRHAQLTWGPVGWLYENLGQARTFENGQEIKQVIVRKPTELSLASPQGPVLLLEPLEPAGSQGTFQAGPQAAPFGAAAPAPQPGFGPPPGGYGPPAADYGAPAAGYGPPPAGYGAPAAGYGPAGGYGPPPGGYGPPPGGYGLPPGWVTPPGGPRAAHHEGVGEELATAFEILIPIKTWLKDAGWHQGLRLLVIAYALLPLLFLALLSSSSSLSVPGFAYSLYVAPLWAIAFWLLLRPGRVGALEIYVGIGIVVWVTIWLYAVTVNINDQLVNAVRNGNFLAALAVGYNEEVTKALPILLAALVLLKFRNTKLDVRMWMLLGTVSGLTFGVLEERLYTEMAIAQVANASAVSQADTGVLDFAFRVFVDGFEHAVWAGVSAFFIGIAINYPRRRWQLILLGVSMVAILHGLNDWSVSEFNSYWPGIIIQAVSLLLFIGYTMSASSIERQVRRTPLFRGDSMAMEIISEPKDPDRS
ncbi:MAG TPA: PrsW family glutamic-type intramembrane protease [Streptosporangiaceae bacterium]|nr:PrsW family glutamic-type intramembrane protease [Streptosporangiaceae bacterium]